MQKHETFKIESDDLILTKEQVNFLRAENSRLTATIKIMQKLCTNAGFYKYYFKNLKKFESNKQCFDYVNQLYYDHFNVYRYTSYDQFKSKLCKYGK